MPVKTYDPSKVLISVDGISITGIAKDSFVKVEHDEASWSKSVGADGLVSRAKSSNYAGKITITLEQTSEGNIFLSDLHALDKTTNAGICAIHIYDLSGSSVYIVAEGWPQKHADADFGVEVKQREWVFDCGVIDMKTEGN